MQDYELEINMEEFIVNMNKEQNRSSLSRISGLVYGTSEQFYICDKCNQHFKTEIGISLFLLSNEDSSFSYNKGYCKTCFHEIVRETIEKTETINQLIGFLRENFGIQMWQLEDEYSWYGFRIGRGNVLREFKLDIQNKLTDIVPIILDEVNKLLDMEFEDIDSELITKLRAREIKRIREKATRKRQEERELRTIKIIAISVLFIFLGVGVLANWDSIQQIGKGLGGWYNEIMGMILI